MHSLPNQPDEAVTEQPASRRIPFEICEEHRSRPGWQWLIDRLFQDPDDVAADDDEAAA